MNVLLMGMPFGTTDAMVRQYRSQYGHEIRVLIAEGAEQLVLDTAGARHFARHDYTFAAAETAEQVVARVAETWAPDALVCWIPELFPPPRALERCPIKTVAIVSDWNIYYPQLEYNLARYDVVLTDRLGAQTLDLPGAKAQYLFPLYSYRSTDHRKLDVEKDIDVVFLGNLNHAIHAERGRYLEAVADLSDRYRVVLRHGVYGEEYVRLFNRSRIVLNCALRQEMNLRCFEAPACNALLFVGEDNLEIGEYLRDREEVVLYRPDNVIALVEYYLSHPDEAARVTRQGHARIQELAGERRFDALFNWIAEQPMGERAFVRFPEERQVYASLMQYSSSLVPAQRVENEAFVGDAVRRYPQRPEFLVVEGCSLMERLPSTTGDEHAALSRTAIQRLKEACRLRDDCCVLWMNLALVCRESQSWSAAEVGCLEFVLKATSCDYGGLLLGRFLDPYYARWRRALACHEARPEILWAAAATRLAEIWLEHERYEDACEWAARSIAWLPDVALPYRHRALAEARLGHLDEAARYLSDGLCYTAFDAGYRMDLCNLLHALGRSDEARFLAEASIRIFSAYGDGESAVRSFQEILDAI